MRHLALLAVILTAFLFSGSAKALPTMTYPPFGAEFEYTQGDAVSLQVLCTCAAGGCTYLQNGGTFPSGVGLSSSTGLISGTTTAVSRAGVGITCRDSTGDRTRNIIFDVHAPLQCVDSPPQPYDGSCPPKTCEDGSTVPDGGICPVYQCWDGSTVGNPASCPTPPDETQPPQGAEVVALLFDQMDFTSLLALVTGIAVTAIALSCAMVGFRLVKRSVK